MQHLRGADDGLPDAVALAGHHLLGDEDLLCRNFNTQISTGHHDAIASLQDLIKSKKNPKTLSCRVGSLSKGLHIHTLLTDVCQLETIHTPAHALMVLKLADDLDVFALVPENFPDSVNVSSLADEGGKDHVDPLLHPELQVLNVLLGHGGQVDSGSGQVDALLAAEHTTVLDLTHEVVAPLERSGKRKLLLSALFGRHAMKEARVSVPTNFFDLQGNETVIDVDVASDLDNLGDVFVVEPEDLLVTVVFEPVVKRELDGFTFLQLDLSGATLTRPGSHVTILSALTAVP